ncbi:MAG: 50S ribosomal protein L19 [Phycisphaerae bacterium]
MRNRLIQAVEAAHLKGTPPSFAIGDTVNVGVRIVEGGKERVQPYIGVVTAQRGGGSSAMFTVRRIVNNEGVERTFPLHSPKVASVEVMRHGKVRRAKLYFLRDRLGKASRLSERRETSGDEKSAEGKSAEKGRKPAMAGAV